MSGYIITWNICTGKEYVGSGDINTFVKRIQERNMSSISALRKERVNSYELK